MEDLQISWLKHWHMLLLYGIPRNHVHHNDRVLSKLCSISNGLQYHQRFQLYKKDLKSASVSRGRIWTCWRQSLMLFFSPFGIAKMANKNDGIFSEWIFARTSMIQRLEEFGKRIWQHIEHPQKDYCMASVYFLHFLATLVLAPMEFQWDQSWTSEWSSDIIIFNLTNLYILLHDIAMRLHFSYPYHISFTLTCVDVHFGYPSPPSTVKELSHMDSETSVDDSEASGTSGLAVGWRVATHQLRGFLIGVDSSGIRPTSCNW